MKQTPGRKAEGLILLLTTSVPIEPQQSDSDPHALYTALEAKEAQNEKFFKAQRTDTITIVEHNFDVNRVVITQTSSLSGNAISNP